MIPLLICAYRPRYLEVVLDWMRAGGVHLGYRIFGWDNGGAEAIYGRAGVQCLSVRDKATQTVINVGKAVAMRHLVDAVSRAMPDADCYVCVDDDVVVDRSHLDALVAAARRPGLGMIGARFHPFNTVMPDGGTVTCVDPCPDCRGRGEPVADARCPRCGGSGRDPEGLKLRTYPTEDRTVRKLGRVAGTAFAVSKAAIGKLSWAPHLYPIMTDAERRPVVYWGEDAVLDGALTEAGLVNGYLEGAQHTPAIHLPELDRGYMEWKLKARITPPASGFER